MFRSMQVGYRWLPFLQSEVRKFTGLARTTALDLHAHNFYSVGYDRSGRSFVQKYACSIKGVLETYDTIGLALAHAGKHWTPGQIQTRTYNFLHNYKEKYIDTGSIKPLTDTMIGLFFFSYLVAWPQVSKSLDMTASLPARMWLEYSWDIDPQNLSA